ncbi:ABC transporter substrate-binding protein [Plastorhodobacter daqingensis]|uniref:ABC transporter substrate-binding protein n=1 Tax=Plastorhodobacter daqingensis TaxID=1387281 RepID=A0ABW2UQU1_9RHOB
MKPVLAAGALAFALAAPAVAGPDPADWDAVLAEARGQTVYWNAWGGDPRVNAFIEWVGDLAAARHGVRLEHVKLADTSAAVTRVLSEKSAGRDTGGAIDLIWINGANFAAMKENDLLFGGFAEALPNWRLLDPDANPALVTDFTVPIEGYESPWALAQLVFEHDADRLPDPPRTIRALADWIAQNPGRFTYPQPPDYLGTTFLKQVLLELAPDAGALSAPVDEAEYARQTAPLWDWLDEVSPHLWRGGAAYPANEPALAQLLADDEIEIGFAFNPGRASAAIAAGELADTVRTFVLDGGTIGNASFVAIPYNASNIAGALVIANLLLEPEVQARAQDPAVLGFQTVLAMDRLEPADAERFRALELGIATLPPEALGPVLPEPHPSWMTRIAADWLGRYGVAQ